MRALNVGGRVGAALQGLRSRGPGKQGQAGAGAKEEEEEEEEARRKGEGMVVVVVLLCSQLRGARLTESKVREGGRCMRACCAVVCGVCVSRVASVFYGPRVCECMGTCACAPVGVELSMVPYLRNPRSASAFAIVVCVCVCVCVCVPPPLQCAPSSAPPWPLCTPVCYPSNLPAGLRHLYRLSSKRPCIIIPWSACTLPSRPRNLPCTAPNRYPSSCVTSEEVLWWLVFCVTHTCAAPSPPLLSILLCAARSSQLACGGVRHVRRRRPAAGVSRWGGCIPTSPLKAVDHALLPFLCASLQPLESSQGPHRAHPFQFQFATMSCLACYGQPGQSVQCACAPKQLLCQDVLRSPPRLCTKRTKPGAWLLHPVCACSAPHDAWLGKAAGRPGVQIIARCLGHMVTYLLSLYSPCALSVLMWGLSLPHAH